MPSSGEFTPSPPTMDNNISPLSQPSSSRISPSILLIIVILAVIFFVSGLLHLLVRYLLKPPTYRDADDVSVDATALQGQLQQLFHLHDSGVDQSLIDTLPVFPYKAITGGVNDPFDCAVCLCEFDPDSNLRLLPKCCHAFHTDCIDTWLLSHSTCPLCRTALHPSDYSPARCCSPVLVLVDSAAAGESSSANDIQDIEIGPKEEKVEEETKVVRIKLGKFRSVEGSSDVPVLGEDSSLDQRRCFSMGTYEYVMSENSLLRVAIKPSSKKKERPNRAMSECDCHSKREGFKGFGEERAKESFSESKKIDADCSKRTFSFRLPGLRNESKAKSAVSPRTAVSEFDMDDDVEVGSCNNSVVSMGSQIEKTPSFARRTLLWIVGRQNRVGSMS